MSIAEHPARTSARTAMHRIPVVIAEAQMDRCALRYRENNTNQLLWSDDLSNAAWIKGGVQVTPNVITAPDGTLTGCLLDDDQVGVLEQMYQRITVPDDLLNRTCSIYLKKYTALITRIAFQYAIGGTTSVCFIFVDWLTMAVTNIGGSALIVEDVVDGWLRVAITLPNNATGNTELGLFILPESTASAIGGVYAWRAQINDGSVLGHPVKTEAASTSRMCRGGVSTAFFDDFYAGINEAEVTNATLSHSTIRRTLTWTPTAADPQLYMATSKSTPGTMTVDGALYHRVRMRVMKLSGAPTWQGVCYFRTAATGYTGGNAVTLADPGLVDGEWQVLEWDFSAHATWLASVITGLRFDLCSNFAGAYAIDYVDVVKVLAVTGDECYNTFFTCQDQDNYSRMLHADKYCMPGSSIPAGMTIRPYIQSVAGASTELPNFGGLARRAVLTLGMVDEPGLDTSNDPYFATRAEPAAGSYWTRWLARNPNYAGRFVKVRRGFVVDPWDWNTFKDELYVIDKISGPDANGNVRVVLKDPLKLTDRDKIPLPTDGELLYDVSIVDVTLTVKTGKGVQYAGIDDHIRIDDEVIKVGAWVGDTATGLVRAQFGTIAEAHDADSNVQLCKSWIDQDLTAVIQDIENTSGIADINIDVAALQAAESAYFGNAYKITACITDPEDPSKLLDELGVLGNAVILWDPVAQKVGFRVIAPEPVGSTLPLWTDERTFIDGSVSVTPQDDARITRSYLRFGLKNVTDDKEEPKFYSVTRGNIDAAAEDVNGYGDRRPDVVYSRWFRPQNDGAALTYTGRRLTRYRDAPKIIQAKIDPKDYDRTLGDLVEIETTQLVDQHGKPKRTTCLVRKIDDKGDVIDVHLETTLLGGRRAFIAPAGTPDYPADDVYAHIADATGKMSDGTDGWVIT